MNSLINQIYNLAIMKVGNILPIYQGNDVVYLYRSISGYAIAIPFNDERIFDESFVGVSLSTNYLNYDNESIKVLYLNMNDTGDLKKFSYIGAEFISLENRFSILNNPYDWIDEWCEIFGNSKKKYKISDVIAELISLKYLYEKDKSAVWEGPNGGSHDIVLNEYVVEVKSTTSKNDYTAFVNSRFQIDPTINEKLFYVRLELKPYTNSIDTLVNDLVQLGYSESELELCLSQKGYRKGNRIRKITYGLLSLDSYDVNENNFPVIDIDDINDLTISKNVINFELKIDLANSNRTKLL